MKIEKNKPERKNIFILVLVSLLLVVSIFSAASFAAERNVTITLNIFTKKDIEIIIQPPVKTAIPGTAVSYSVLIKNPNPISLNLDLSYVLPPGWTGELQDTVTVGPKNTKSVTFKVTSEPSTEIGSYAVEIDASSSDGSFVQGKGKASYNADIHSGADVTITPEIQTALPGKTLQYTVHVKNNDPVGFDPSTFTVSPILPNGWKGTLKRGSESTTSMTTKLAPEEVTDITYEVTSLATSKSGETVGVNVTSNKVGSEGYALYDVTLCGDGICSDSESSETCSLDCGTDKFFCKNDRCDAQVDDGVKFSASSDFQFSTFLICKYGVSTAQCENAKNNCGIDQPCICASNSGILSLNGACNLRCVDNDGSYYIYAKGLDASARSIYNYSFTCPYVNLDEIKQMNTDFSSSLSKYDQARSALAETINRDPTQKFNLQPCVDAYGLAVNQVSDFVNFLDGIISSPAISNTTEARSRSDKITQDIESSIRTYCASGSTGLLSITDMNQPSTTEIRNNVEGSVGVRNTGAISYFGLVKCDFTLGKSSVTYNSSCTSFDPGASITFKPSVTPALPGTWNMQCRVYGSLSSNCTGESLHDTSQKLQFDAFSKDIFVVDVAGSCTQSGVVCNVRANNDKDCVQCSMGNTACTKTSKSGATTTFSCPALKGNFTLRGYATASDNCTPVAPMEKIIQSRCAYCGDGIVDFSLGEECEPANTDNNQYVAQESGLLCKGKMSAVRDEFGFCSSTCKKSPDPVNYTCQIGVCGADCSDGDTKTITLQKPNGVCSYTQQCGSSCSFIQGDCEAPDLSVVSSPQAPTTSDVVDITATTINPNVNKIEIFVDGSSAQTCVSSPCVLSSSYSKGVHKYHATLVSLNGTSSNPLTGDKIFTVGDAGTNNSQTFGSGDMLLTVGYSPQNPISNDIVKISAESDFSSISSIDIFVDGQLQQSCILSPCYYSSRFSSGPHTYYSKLTSGPVSVRAPDTGTLGFNVAASQCLVTITNSSCKYDTEKRRYVVYAFGYWNSVAPYHAHIDIDNFTSQKLLTNDISFSSEQSGPGLKNIKAIVHDLNDSVVCQDQKQILCDGNGNIDGQGLGVVRKINSNVGLTSVPMKIIVVSDKNINDLQFTEYVQKSLKVSNITVAGNSSGFIISGPTTIRDAGVDFNSYLIEGSLGQLENLSITYNVKFESEGSYRFFYTALYNKSQKTDEVTVYASNCPQPSAVYARNDSDCKQFVSSCKVPIGWTIISNCPSTYKPGAEPVDLISIVAVVIIVVILVFAYVYRNKIRDRFEAMSEKRLIDKISNRE